MYTIPLKYGNNFNIIVNVFVIVPMQPFFYVLETFLRNMNDSNTKPFSIICTSRNSFLESFKNKN